MTTTPKPFILSPRGLWRRLKMLRRQIKLSRQPTAQVFEDIYRSNSWGDAQSVSGAGSSLNHTEKVRAALPTLLKKYACHSLLDIPCGDFNWMKTLELDADYTGADIVGNLIALNQAQYASPERKFIKLDLLRDPLPKVDLILCRDCLVHFSYADILTALKNAQASGSTYLLTTTFPEQGKNQSIVTGEWRPLNLGLAPFHWPAPVELVDDTADFPNYRQKYLGLWKIAGLPAALSA